MSQATLEAMPHGTFRVQPLSAQIWEAVQVFPAVLAKEIGGRRDKALKALQKCGIANVQYLCQKANVEFNPKAPVNRTAGSLREAISGDTLVYLTEFARPRALSILEQYDAEVSQPERDYHDSEIEALSRKRRPEQPRVLTKLLLMYMRDPGVIQRIQFRHLWRTARAFAEFQSPAFPEDAVPRLTAALGQLVVSLQCLPDGKKLQVYGDRRLDGGPHVFVLQRGYREKVVPEYPAGCQVTNAVGHLAIGVHDDPPRMEVKVANAKFVETIRQWAQSVLKIDLVPKGVELFDAYDAKELEKRLLGEYDESHKLAVVGIRFRRTPLPNHPSITVEAGYGGGTIRDALAWYVEKGSLALRSLSDIEWLKVNLKGMEGQIDVKVEPDGSVRFTLDNARWREDTQAELAKAFEQTFGLPLDQRINPRTLSMGALEIYQSLLEWGDADEVQPHQRELFEDLKARGLVNVSPETFRGCSTAFCKRRGKRVEDHNIDACPECHQPIRDRQVRSIKHDEGQMRKFAGLILRRAVKWELAATPSRFEGLEFFPLRNPNRPEEAVYVFFSRRISMAKVEVFDRSMWPILVVHTSGTYEHAHLDLAGVAHLGFAYALAATKDGETAKRFIADCKSTLNDLLRNEQERVLRAARASRELLSSADEKITGGSYESAVFGLLRSIFPHSMKWGGAFRPDGFCSLLFSETNRLNDLQKHNWSYDSKYSERADGYGFGAGEHRKLFDYITALVEQKELQVEGNQLNAHVIISNRLETSKMKDAVNFLKREHRLGQNLPTLQLVFMMEPFLVTMYDRVRTDEQQLSQRWGYLSQRTAWRMRQATADGYVLLDAQAANEIVDWVLSKPPVERPVDIAALQDSLDETMTGK